MSEILLIPLDRARSSIERNQLSAMMRNHCANPIRSGRQALAAVGATSGQNLAACLGAQAGTEAMATLADKLGRLISTFHGSFSAVAAGCR
ncbi:hypothetical protein BA190_25625 [Labrys sp. WJW]|nr:hypothetical protein BA190_25625 [Labrys sp. WJW]